jgi:hypothetical protein
MRGKLLFVTGAAVGYVLGARAGRKRYEQIRSAASKVWESPGIQKQVTAVEDFVAARVGDVPGALYEGAKKLAVQVASKPKQSAASAPARTATPAATPAPSPAAKAAVDEAKKPAARKPAAKKPAAAKPATKKPAAGAASETTDDASA